MENIKCSYSDLLPIDQLIPHPKNRNKHSKEQIEQLAKIINYHGQIHPIKVSTLSGNIVIGHGRVEALKLLGWEVAAVDYIDFENETDEYLCMTSDNAIASQAEIDLAAINLDIPDIGPFDLELLGFKDFVVDMSEKLEPGCDEDEVPEVKNAITRRGDIWILGNHRLMCGDSTMIDDVEKLMNGERADFWITDPPYGVAYESSGNKDKHEKILNDSLPMESMKELWFKVASNALMVTTGECAYYWFACQGGDQMMMMMMMMMIGEAP